MPCHHDPNCACACQNAELVQEWVIRINMALRTLSLRPSSLLVIVNPFGGARRARKVWRRVAHPIFHSAGHPHDLLFGLQHFLSLYDNPATFSVIGSFPRKKQIAAQELPQ